MKILHNKINGTVSVKVNGGRVYLAPADEHEQAFLKYAAHMLVQEDSLLKAVYRNDSKYIFATRDNDTILFDAKNIEDEGDARYETDAFFEGQTAELFDETEVPNVRANPLEDNRVRLAIALVLALMALYGIFTITAPKKQVTVNSGPEVKKPLTETEKYSLKVQGTRRVATEINNIIATARKDPYARIANLTVQKSESPYNVSYVISTGTEYRYPVKGSQLRAPGIWGKSDAQTISLERSDEQQPTSEDFIMCSLKMLNNGYNVRQRDEQTATFDYEDDAMKTLDSYNAILTHCNATLNSLTIAADRGKTDVTLSE